MQGAADRSRVGGEARVHYEDGALPAGFIPIRQTKSLFQMGTWPALRQDAAPAFYPVRTLLHMARRNGEQDADARAWKDLYGRATKGEAAAQLEMGVVCETGRFGAPVDLQRAYFWYYRAALQENAAAREYAQRLAHTVAIDPATMEEPRLVSDGLWVALVDKAAQGLTRILFGLQADGSLKGRVLDVGGEAMRVINAVSRLEAGGRSFVGNVFMSMRYKGRWRYHQERLLLTLDLLTYAEGLLGEGQKETLQIQLLGVNQESTLFGRDGERVGYTLRRPTVDETQS